MAFKEIMKYKLTKVTLRTSGVGIIIVVLYYAAKPELAWFIPGAVVAVMGEALRMWAAGHLRKNKELTTTGPYAHVKNPLYIGTLLLTLGYSAMAKNIYIMIAGFAWFFIYYAPYKKAQENEKLISSFGEGWKEYDKAVPDYIPRLSAYPGKGENRWSYAVAKENSEHETAVGVLVGIMVLVYILLH